MRIDGSNSWSDAKVAEVCSVPLHSEQSGSGKCKQTVEVWYLFSSFFRMCSKLLQARRDLLLGVRRLWRSWTSCRSVQIMFACQLTRPKSDSRSSIASSHPGERHV